MTATGRDIDPYLCPAVISGGVPQPLSGREGTNVVAQERVPVAPASPPEVDYRRGLRRVRLFHENAEEFGIPWRGDRRGPTRRGRRRRRPEISALVWGTVHPSSCSCTAARRTRTPGTPSRSRSIVRSSRSTSRATVTPRIATITRTGRPRTRSRVEQAVRALAPDARWSSACRSAASPSLALTDRAPDLVRTLVLVDVTPGVNREKSSAIAEFIDGPEYFEPSTRSSSARCVQPDAQRVVAAARHPAQRDRSCRRSLAVALRPPAPRFRRRRRRSDHARASTTCGTPSSACKVPFTLVRGALSPVVDDEDVAEVLRRNPNARGRRGRGRRSQHPGRQAARACGDPRPKPGSASPGA